MSISNALRSLYLPGNGHLRPYCQDIFHGLWRPGDDANRLRAIGLTSSYGGEGVSTLAANLAIVAAAGGAGRVLLVDANLSHPTLHDIFGFPLFPGLVEFLAGRSPADCVHPVIESPHLTVLTVGTTPDAMDGELGAAFAKRIEILKHAYDCVILDLPPVEEAMFLPALFAPLDGVLLVTESERVQRRSLWRTKCALEGAGAKILGVVVNKQRAYIPRWLDNILPAQPHYPPRHPR